MLSASFEVSKNHVQKGSARKAYYILFFFQFLSNLLRKPNLPVPNGIECQREEKVAIRSDYRAVIYSY